MNNTYETKLTLSSVGLPTAVASATEKTMLSGAIAHITNAVTLSADTVVIGPGRTLGEVAMVIGSAMFARKQGGLPFSWNPYSSS